MDFPGTGALEVSTSSSSLGPVTHGSSFFIRMIRASAARQGTGMGRQQSTPPHLRGESSGAGCRLCGACCTSHDVLLTASEADRYEADPRLARLLRYERSDSGTELVFLQRDRTTGRCRALAGPPGDSRCTIYARRPRLCRLFPADGPECITTRATRTAPQSQS